MTEVTIEAPDNAKSKGRSFRGDLLAWVEADGLWAGGGADTETHRPVFAVFACADGEASAFTANLRCGRRCEAVSERYRSRSNKPDRWEFLRGGDYQYGMQRHVSVGATAIQVTMPPLMRIDGVGMVEKEGAAFVVLPTRAWAERQTFDDEAVLRHLEAVKVGPYPHQLREHFPRLGATAALFAAYLDRRTRCPLIPDVRFYAQVMVAALDGGLASIGVERNPYGEVPWGVARALGYTEHHLADAGLLAGVAFKSDHERLEVFLAGEAARFMKRAKV